MAWFFDVLSKCFKVKEPSYLHKDVMLDHLGMVLLEDDEGTYLTMQLYIELIFKRLDVDVDGQLIQVLMSQPPQILGQMWNMEHKLRGMC